MESLNMFEYIAIGIIILFAIHIIYTIYSIYIVMKNNIYNDDNFDKFKEELDTYKVEFLVNNHCEKQYCSVYYRGYFIGYDRNKNVAVFPHPSKTSYKDIDNLYADLTILNGSDIKVKEFKHY